MRREFAKAIEDLAVKNEKIIFLTGDLGFMALESLREAIGDRFINTGVSEQNMISMAASLAYEDLLPICYSIAPFIVFRPAEQIRIDVCLHDLNVKIIGNGGGFGYGIMGSTHHAIEDLAVISSFQNMRCYIPFCNEDVPGAVNKMLEQTGPSYLRLGYGNKPQNIETGAFSSVRKLLSGKNITIVGMGPVILNALQALSGKEKKTADVFVVSEIPLFHLPEEVKQSLHRTKKLIVIEEHTKRGGLGENLATLILEEQINCKFAHCYVKGYPNGLSGSQAYHQKINGLDMLSLKAEIIKMINL